MRNDVLPLNLYIQKDLRLAVDSEAKKQGRTIRTVVERALKRGLSNRGIVSPDTTSRSR